MSKLKIAFFIEVLKEDLDGVSNTSHRIIEKLASENIEPIFITGLPPKSVDFPYPVLVIDGLRLPYLKDYPLVLPGNRGKVFQALDDFSPDLIHWSTPSLLGKYAIAYAKSRGIPNLTIYHSHFCSYIDYFKRLPFKNALKRKINAALVKLYSDASIILAPTPSMKEFLQAEGIEASRVVIWGRGIDPHRFNPTHCSDEMIAKMGGGDKWKLLFVSRLVHYKDTDTLIRLSHILPPNVTLTIVGEGPELAKMQAQCHGGNTFFTGKLVGRELSEAYASADLFLFPSLTDTFGNVVIEAMASGLPVIAASAGGPKDIVKHGASGYLVAPKSESQFNDYIKLVTRDQSLYQRLSDNALAYASGLSWETLINQLCSRYKTLVNESAYER